MRRFLNRLRAYLSPGRSERSLAREMAAHLALVEDDYRRRGLSPEEARLAARRAMGGVEQAKELQRDARSFRWLEDLRRDAGYAVRTLRRTPGLTLVTVLTLGLGIGANTAIFSVLHAVTLRPLPFDGSERIVAVYETFREFRSGNASPGHVHDWTAHSTVLAGLSAEQGVVYTLLDGGEPERIRGARVTPSFFDVVHADPLHGRYFTDHDSAGGDPVAVLGHGLWQRRFGGDLAVIGTDIRLNGEPHRVLGVAPPAYDLLGAPDLYTALVFTPEQRARYGSHYLRVLAALQPGVSLAAAQADLDRVTRDIAARQPEQMAGRGVRVQPLIEELLGDARPQLLLLLGAVALVLLIACVNAANLLLARSAARRQEFAVRAAIGGGRGRLARQLVTEGLVLSGTGGLVALAVAAAGVRLFATSAPAGLPRVQEAGLHPEVLLFTLAVSIATGVAFSVLPAWRAARAGEPSQLRDGRAATGRASSHAHVRSTLVAGELALAIVLLVGAALLLRSAWLLQQVPLGFEPEAVLTARVALPPDRYPEDGAVSDTYARLLESVRAVPGVASAGTTTNLPLGFDNIDVGLTVDGKTYEPGAIPLANFRLVSDGYLQSLGVALARGRLFAPADMDPGAPRVVVVNETLARQIWGVENPIGRRVSGWAALPETPEWREVIGVVGDMRSFGPESDPRPEMFIPFTQAPVTAWDAYDRSMALVLRAAGGAASLAPFVRRAITSVDPALPLYDVRTIDERLAGVYRSRRFGTLLFTLLAVTALALAAIGVYGVIAYLVAERTPEIAVRRALGATTGVVLGLVLRQTVTLAAVGVSLGLAASFVLTRLLTSALFEVSPRDPLMFAAAAGTLFGLALLASAVPACRAARLDPATALRTE